MFKSILCVLLFAIATIQLVAGHAIVVEPRTRQAWNHVQRKQGTKMSHGTYGSGGGVYPFTEEVFKGCGIPNGNAASQGFGASTQAQVDTPGKITKNFTPGVKHTLKYMLTIPHPNGEEKIYFKWRPDAGSDWLSAGPTSDGFESGDESFGIYDVVVEFPANTDAKNAQLQFVWDSKNDRGGYIECADVCISNNCPDIEDDAVPVFLAKPDPKPNPTPSPTPDSPTPDSPTPASPNPSPTPGTTPDGSNQTCGAYAQIVTSCTLKPGSSTMVCAGKMCANTECCLNSGASSVDASVVAIALSTLATAFAIARA